MLSDLGINTDAARNATRSRMVSISVPSAELFSFKKGGYSQSTEIKKTEFNRIAVFAKGIDADNLPVSVSMKGILSLI